MEDLARRLEQNKSDVASILRALFLPKLYGDSFRLASEGAGMKSGCANMSLTYDTTNWENATSGNILSGNNLMLFLFGNALRAYIQYVYNPGGDEYLYTVYAPDGGTTWPVFARSTTTIVPRYATTSSLFQPHGPILFPGYDNAGNYYLWIDSGNTGTDAAAYGLCVTVPADPAVDNGVIEWYYWDGQGPQRWNYVSLSTMAAPTTYGCTPPPFGAYMFVRVTPAASSAWTSVTVQIRCNQDAYGHHPVADVQTLMTQAYGLRVNSASVKVQNDAAALYKSGKIISATVAKSRPWTSCEFNSIDDLTRFQNYRERTADKGYYGVILPDSDADVSEYYDDICTDSLRGGALVQAAYPLSERRPYKVVGIQIDDQQGRSLTIDVTHTIEYLSNNKYVGQNTSAFSQESLKAAIVIASTMETDYENPTHWKEIVSTIASYIPAGAKALISALRLLNYGEHASLVESRLPLIDDLSQNVVNFTNTKRRKPRY